MPDTSNLERSGEQLADSAKEIERSTEKVKASTVHVEGSADRRTELAGDRTVLAAERTYAAWVRTGLVGLASGIGAKKLLAGIVPEWMILATGSILVLFAAFCFVAGVWRELSPVKAPPHPRTKSLPPAVLIVINGFLALVALTALVGILFGHTGGSP